MTPEGPQFGLPGFEVNLLYIAGLLALLLAGAGTLSLDSLRAAPRGAVPPYAGPEWPGPAGTPRAPGWRERVK
ncbi:MAG: hypothetical protein HY703_07610 [Gemmatimonadetes bacterium]|nr:hypothetical protein [Gemmatimonadota bacterium]